MSDFSISGVYDLPTHHASAAFTSKTSEVFKEDDNIAPIIIKDSASECSESSLSNCRVQPILSNERMHYIPWGGDNQMPFNIISLIESDETLSTCQMFNAMLPHCTSLDGFITTQIFRFHYDPLPLQHPPPRLL